MERIQKALEKAHLQRQQTALHKPLVIEQVNDANADIVEEIAYEQTQTVKVMPDVLMRNRVVSALKNDPRADLFRILRTKVIQKMRADNLNVLALTSPTAGAGKSLIAINLAISIALDVNHSALLVDLDLRNPSIHKYFGLSPKLGLRNYFYDDKNIADLLIHPSLESLVILPAGQPIKESSELLLTPKMLNLTAELKHRYLNRIVIINLPPLLNTDDAMAFVPNVDTCILVVADGHNTKDQIERSVQLIGKDKYLGTVLNNPSPV